MEMKINIKNIKINSISTLGSLNIGKVMFADNHSSSIKLPKEAFEEDKEKEKELKELFPEKPHPPMMEPPPKS